MKTFSKPQEARYIEARARAKRQGVRVNVIEPQMAYSTLSQSQPGVVYTVARDRQGWTCECDGFRFTGCCKHVAAVERRAEREGWDFGAIASIVRNRTPKADPSIGLALLRSGRA